MAGIKDLWLLGVMDGHGVNGHFVSQYVKQHLPQVLNNLIKGNDVSPERKGKRRNSKKAGGFLPSIQGAAGARNQQRG